MNPAMTPVSDLARKVERLPLKDRDTEQILREMQEIADRDYHGMLYENIAPIFREMDEGDRKALLQAGLLRYWQSRVDSAARDLREVMVFEDDGGQVTVSQKTAVKERRHLGQESPDDQIRLKNWLSKALFMGGICLIGVAIGVTIWSNKGVDAALEETGSHIWDIFSLLF